MKYNIYLVEGRSSDFNRTKATLQAVFAGLFPPTESDLFINNTHILPIPYNYVERERDKVGITVWCIDRLSKYVDS